MIFIVVVKPKSSSSMIGWLGLLSGWRNASVASLIPNGPSDSAGIVLSVGAALDSRCMDTSDKIDAIDGCWR